MFDPLAGRIAILLCSLAPMLIWPFSGHSLAHPWQAAAWGLLCAIFSAVTPGRFLKLSLLVQTLAAPLTIGWIGVVAVTGFGPSSGEFDAATSGPIHELWVAIRLACTQWAFVLTAAFTILTIAWAWRINWLTTQPTSFKVELVFLAALVPLACVNMDAAGISRLASIAGPEVRISVPWLSHLGLAKSLLSQTIDGIVGGPSGVKTVRLASRAEKLFETSSGLAVFVVGESLRADALFNAGRGPWSSALQDRLANGLGVRLRDACAGANSTNTSVPFLLTATAPRGIAGVAGKPTILASAKVAGAKTAYIINQGSWIVPESGHDLTQSTATMERQSYDGNAVDALDDFVSRSGSGAKAAILHIYGQHFFYDQRYPSSEFEPIPDNLSPDEREERHYAQAAEYGVKILLGAAHILDKQREPAFLIFTSDHGENLVSDHTGKKYHALPVTGKNDTTVPVVALWNQAFADSGRAKKLTALVEGDGLIAHRDVALAWLALAGAPGDIVPTPAPETWGSLEAGTNASAILCSSLAP